MSIVEKIKAAFVGAISPVRLLDKKIDALTRNVLATTVRKGSLWLDVGCGLRPFEASFREARYVGIDVESSGRGTELKKPDRLFDGMHIPYEDGTFDGILCTMVLEHVEQLDVLLGECHRVLKPSGHFVVSVPFVFREHEQPYDFRRFTTFGMALTMSRHGFAVGSCSKCLSTIETIATLFCVYINNAFGARSRLLRVILGGLITFPALTLSDLLSRLLPDQQDLYCSLVVSSVKTR